MKKIKSFSAGQYFSMYGRVLPASLLVGVPVGFVHGWFSFIIIMLAGIILPLPAIYFIDKFSGFLMFFYNGGGTFSLNEQLAADVEKIRLLKRESRFTEALELAEAVLTRNPEHPEALLLKAQILYEEFSRYSAANACLIKIIAINPPPEDKLLHWATSLQEKILERIRERAELHEER